MKHLQFLALGVLLTVADPCSVWSQPPQPQTITIHLSNFDFAPDRLRLRVGVPVHLQLVNDSSGGHDFSAPTFFAASVVQAGSVPSDGTIAVPSKGTVDLTVVPRSPGTYKLECTHFMHALFGMTGSIIVDPAG